METSRNTPATLATLIRGQTRGIRVALVGMGLDSQRGSIPDRLEALDEIASQLDALAEKGDIVTPEYMEACYRLSEKYPTLCASLYLVCERAA